MTAQPEYHGIGMTDKCAVSQEPMERPVWRAWHETGRAADLLLTQDVMDRTGVLSCDTYRNLAIEHLTRAANHLGYDLVRRQTPQEAHDAALARDRAKGPNDIPAVTSAPGFDGRARTVGPDARDPVGQVLR